jgi:hypothetical protein
VLGQTKSAIKSGVDCGNLWKMWVQSGERVQYAKSIGEEDAEETVGERGEEFKVRFLFDSRE